MPKFKQTAGWPKVPTKHGYFCSDHNPIEEWQPGDPTNVDCWVDIYLGPDDEPSGTFFSFHVVTHKALSNLTGPEKKYLVVLPLYSWKSVDEKIDSILEKCKGYDWSDMCEKLRPYLHWEYEGMSYTSEPMKSPS